jgi:hypothetical protein
VRPRVPRHRVEVRGVGLKVPVRHQAAFRPTMR